MLKGICLGSLAGESFREKMELAKRAGFDAVELGNLNATGVVTPEMTGADVRALRPILEDTLPVHGMFAGDAWKLPLTDNDPAVRQQGLDLMYRSVEVAQILGMTSLLVVPGIVTPQVPYERAYERALAALQKLAAHNHGSGIVIGIENVWNRFLLSPLETARFIDEIGDPDFGAYFDVGNILAYGFSDQWIRTLGHRVKRVHVKDYRGSGPTGHFVPLLAGDVDWPAVMIALQEVGYDSYLTAEIGQFRHCGSEGAFQISRSLDAILGRS
ncbi:MAG: sugar phosphate isomerase/epimerase [Chloroflexi bacterium]|nr:sugar phosphate isomerase/epimerase [Chloroflexota bacterium]